MSHAIATPASGPDLLTAPILPLLLRFALPNMVAMLAVALAAMAETGYVGQLGPSALAGMALVFPFVMLQNMLSAGAMGGGVSSAVSRVLGAGDGQRANVLAVHALWIGVFAGIFFTVLMELLGAWFMQRLGGKGEDLAQAVAYSEVAFSGSVFIWVVNTLSSVIRGSGNMRVPSVTLVLVALAQVFLGGALGLGWLSLPPLGMQGVAAGGVLANAAGAVFLWAYLSAGHGKVKLSIRGTRLVRHHLQDILRVGAVACISPFQSVLTILILTR
ncbi:MAG: MATE family efflux transporter, partial [Betaproteobacteria bacterium]|nr:MATE family efflux transporter [Betaproteobacteria bacterium]